MVTCFCVSGLWLGVGSGMMLVVPEIANRIDRKATTATAENKSDFVIMGG